MTNEYYEHVQYVTHRTKYKKVDTDIILDTELSKNDLAIYLAILRYVDFNGQHTKITGKDITGITGIQQARQGKSLDKLILKGYIFSQVGVNCIEYIVGDLGDKYTRLRLDYFDSLKTNVKDFVRKLRYISLSNGNDRLPPRAVCNQRTNITKEEYRILKTYESNSDIDLYDSLQIKGSKEVKKKVSVIALNGSLDEQLDALLG